MQENLIGYHKQELSEKMLEKQQQKFRGQQIYEWLYVHGAQDIGDMTNLSKKLRHELAQDFCVTRPKIIQKQISRDGTIKWLLQCHDGEKIETVYIPESDRGTLCISSQVGCTLNCKFCLTGTQKLVRNLTCGEIIAQLMIARDELHDWPAYQDPHNQQRIITNIVMMGMGEPLYNTDNVIKSLQLFIAQDAFGLSKRRVTLSTSGIVPQMQRVGIETGVRLAISLHATHDELRNILVPINKKYPLAMLIDAVRHYSGVDNAHRVTWEYVMLKDVNDTLDDAKKLLDLIADIPSKVNLIPFNPWSVNGIASGFETSPKDNINQFADYLAHNGISAPVRQPRGRDISAACGQLKSDSVRQRKAIADSRTRTAEISA